MDLSVRMTKRQLGEFVGFVEELSGRIGFKVSSRGWGYILEQEGLITKEGFDKVEAVINRCRRQGLLPVDFVAEESARAFSGVEVPTSDSPAKHVLGWAQAALETEKYFTPDWWEGEEVYIQMVVEKIDLVTLFAPICERFHIPIANSKGWSSILQRAEYCRRFAEAEVRQLKGILLVCGDFDPDGVRITDTMRKNLEDVSKVRWNDGFEGYDPANLEIVRFGLDFDFIQRNKLPWINNLITGSGLDLASKAHKNHRLPYVQQYLRKVGRRKCEANSIVIAPRMGERLCEETILKYLGRDAEERFAEKRLLAKGRIEETLEETGAGKLLRRAVKALKDHTP